MLTHATALPSYNLNKISISCGNYSCLEIEIIGLGTSELRYPAAVFFNAGFFSMSKADLAAAPEACICACDQADDKSNAAHREKDKLKGP